MKNRKICAPELNTNIPGNTQNQLKGSKFGLEQRLPEAGPLTFPLQRVSLHRL